MWLLFSLSIFWMICSCSACLYLVKVLRGPPPADGPETAESVSTSTSILWIWGGFAPVEAHGRSQSGANHLQTDIHILSLLCISSILRDLVQFYSSSSLDFVHFLSSFSAALVQFLSSFSPVLVQDEACSILFLIHF